MKILELKIEMEVKSDKAESPIVIDLIYSEEFKMFLVKKESISFKHFGVNTTKAIVEALEEANKLKCT